MIVYRVMLKIGYYERWFEFKDSLEAFSFAGTALNHSVKSEDNEKMVKVVVELVDQEQEDIRDGMDV